MSAILETFATLRLFSPDMSPKEISGHLSLAATQSHERDSNARSRTKREANYWAWCTEHIVCSDDPLVHVREIITTFSTKNLVLDQLRQAGCETDVCGYVVNTGQGGPYLDLMAMKGLVKLGLPVWWDVYFGNDDET